MELSRPKLKEFLYFFVKKKFLYFKRELAKPKKQKFLIFSEMERFSPNLKNPLHFSKNNFPYILGNETFQPQA